MADKECALIDEKGTLTSDGWRAFGFESVNEDLEPVPSADRSWWLHRELGLQLGSDYSPLGVLRFAYSNAFQRGKSDQQKDFRRVIGLKE